MNEYTPKEAFWRLRNPVAWGVALTTMFILCVVYLLVLPTCSRSLLGNEVCQTKLKYLLSATPNEVGDSFAGLAGALAFIWIIVTVAFQSIELSEQRKVLTEQKEETAELRSATQAMAEAMQTQAKLFSDENRLRKIELADKTNDELLRGFLWQATHEMTRRMKWVLAAMEGPLFEVSVSIELESDDFDQSFMQLADHISQLDTVLMAYFANASLMSAPQKEDAFHTLIQTLEEILSQHNDISDAQKVKLERLGAAQMLRSLKEINGNSNFWLQERVKA